MNSRGDVFRSKAVGCAWAAQMVQRSDVRDLFIRLAGQWSAMAEQADTLNALERWRLTPAE